MAENNFLLRIIASLKKEESKKQIQSDAKNLGEIKVPLTGTLDKAKTKAQIQKDLSSLNGTVNLTGKVDKKDITASVQQATKQAQTVANKNTIKVNVDLKRDKLINDIKVFGQLNSKMMKDANMSAKYNSLLDNAKLATSNKEIQNLRLQLAAMRSEIKATNLSGLTLGDTFKKTFKRATELFSGTGGVILLTQQLRKAWTEALNLDKAYTNLIKVQDELSRGDYPEYLDRCNKKAQDLATTQQGLMESVTEFSKSGYNLTTSDKLTEKSTILSNVGDMSASDSAKAIISGVQAYDTVDEYLDVVDKAQALIDKYNEIGNTASITTAEIAQGVQSVGSVFADANTSVDEFIALLAAGNRQFQDADSLALGLRTAALRIRGAKVELEQLGEESEDVYTSASKLQEKIEGLTNVNGNGGVKILEADGETFRSIYDIFIDLSKVYQQMSDVDQSALLELISGKHRASAISATISNMSEATEIYERSLNSAGSAQKEYDTYLESSEASLNRFKSTMTETYQSVIDGETIKGILNCGTATLQFVNSLGLLESTLKGLVAIGIVKTITTLSTAFKASAIQASNFGQALKLASNVPDGNLSSKYNTLKNIAVATKTLTEAQLKQVLSNKSLSEADRIRILRLSGLTKEQAQAKIAQMGLTQSTKEQTSATFSLTAAMKGFGQNLKEVFLNNPIGISIMTLSMVIGAVTNQVDKYKEKIEETRQKSKELSDAWKEDNTSLNDTISQYKELNKKMNDNSLSTEEVKTVKEQLTSIQDTLNQKYGDEADSIDLVNGKYDEQIAKLDELSKKKAQDYIAENSGNVKEDKKYLEDVISYKNTTDMSRYQTNLGNDEAEKQYKEAEKIYKKYLKKYETLSLGYDYYKGTTGLRLNLKGTRDEIQTQLSQLFAELNEDYKSNPPEFIQGLKNVITETLNMDDFDTAKIEDAKNNIKAYTEAEILANNKTRNLYNDSVEAVEAYNDALASGKGVDEAKKNLDDIKQKVSEAIKGYEGYDTVFNDIFDAVQKADEKIAEKTAEVKEDLSSTSNTTITFKAAFNADDFKDIKEKLLELAKAGELTPYTISSTKEYNTLLEQTGLTAEQVYNRIMKIAHTDMTDADWQTTLTNARSQISNIQKALEELNTNGESSTFIDTIISDYPQLLGYLGNEQEMREQLIALQDEQKDSANLAYTNLIADSEVYYETLKTQEAEKLTTINNTANAIISGNKYLVDVLGKNYKIDLNNYKSIADAKAKLETELIKNSASAWSKFYQVQVNASTGLAEVIGSSTTTPSEYMGSDGDYGKAVSKYTKEQNKQKKAAQATADAYNKVIASLNNVASATNITTGIGSGSGGGSSSKNTKTITKFSQTIDWCAETITNLSNKISNLNAKLNNTDGLQKQIKYYKQLITAQNGLIKGYEKTANRYQKAYNKALKKLSKADQNKVKNGTYTIEQFSGKAKSGKKSSAEKRYNNIQSAIEARDNLINNSTDLEEAKAQLKEYAEALASVRWDKASERVEKLNSKLSVLETRMGNVSGYKAKNKVLNDQLKLQKQILTAQENAVKNTQTDANSYYKKISAKYKKNKNSDGTIKTTGVTNATQLKYIKIYNAYVKQLAEETVELSQAQEDYTAAVNEAAITRADNVKNDYDNKISLLEATESKLNSEIELAEARGQVASANYYKMLTDNSKEIKKQREEEKAELESQLATLEPYSDTWYEVKQAIIEVDQAIADETQNAVENINKQIDAMKELTNQVNAYITSATDALGWYDDLIDDKDLYDDNGNLTNKAYALLKLKEGEIEGSKTRQGNYENNLTELEEKYKNGDITEAKYLTEKLELEEKIRDEYKIQIDLRKEQNEIIKDGYKAQKEALDKIIEKKKKALDLDKSEYDYRKSITEKTKNIADLQKQLAMLEGDNSEEAMAQKQQLKVQLEDAQEDLKDTQWEKYIERYEDAMGDLSDRLDVLIEKLDDLTAEELIKLVAENDDSANAGMNEISNENEVPISVLGDTGSSVATGSTEQMPETYKEANNYANDTYNAPVDTTPTNTTLQIPTDLFGNANLQNAGTEVLLDTDTANKVKKFITNKDNTTKAKKKKSEYGILNKEIYDITNGRILSKANRLKLAKMLNVTDANKDGDITGAEAKKVVELIKQIPGFSNGGIVQAVKRNGDDGIATLKVGESVLTPAQTTALMELGKNLVPLNNLVDVIQRPNIPSIERGVSSATTNNIENTFEFNLPNVTDAESFKKAIQTDNSLLRTIQSAGTDVRNSNRKFGVNRL